MTDIISKRIRGEFEDYFSAESTLREIKRLFENHDVPFEEHPVGENFTGQRRELVNNFYRAVNWSDPKDCERVFKVYEDVLSQVENNSYTFDDGTHTNKWYASLTKVLSKEGFPYVDGKIVRMEALDFTDLHEATSILEPSHFMAYAKRIRGSINTDPSLAIGSTKELIESVLKTILVKSNIEFEKDADIPKLLKITQKKLNLLPEDIPENARGYEIIKVLLSNLSQVVIKLTELRNLYGTGHGSEYPNKGIQVRHARLAVNSGIALSTFLLETFDFRDNK